MDQEVEHEQQQRDAVTALAKYEGTDAFLLKMKGLSSLSRRQAETALRVLDGRGQYPA